MRQCGWTYTSTSRMPSARCACARARLRSVGVDPAIPARDAPPGRDPFVLAVRPSVPSVRRPPLLPAEELRPATDRREAAAILRGRRPLLARTLT